MIIARDCDPLRRSAWSMLRNCGLFTISASRARPSAEIRVVETKKLRLFMISAARARPSAEIRVVAVQKLRTFYDFCKPRATLCGDSRGRGSNLRTFYDFCKPRATLCGDSRGRGSKTERLFTISASRARASAQIRVVEVQNCGLLTIFCKPRATLCGDSRGRGSNLRTFYDFCKPRATLCGDSRGRGSKTERLFTISASRARPSAQIRVVEVQKLSDFLRFYASRARPSAGIVRVEALSLWRRALAKWPLEVVSWLARLLSQSRGRGFDSPLVRGSSGLKIAAFKYKRSTQSVLLHLRLENRNF